MRFNILIAGLLLSASFSFAQEENFSGKKFEQLGTMLPTPNSYRSASGVPGPEYWQQKADYIIDVELDDEHQSVSGFEEITYTNNSPDPLSYLWLQLEQNMRNKASDTYSTATSQINDDLTERNLKSMVGHNFDLVFKIMEVKD
jgi:hypothetical protein